MNEKNVPLTTKAMEEVISDSQALSSPFQAYQQAALDRLSGVSSVKAPQEPRGVAERQTSLESLPESCSSSHKHKLTNYNEALARISSQCSRRMSISERRSLSTELLADGMLRAPSPSLRKIKPLGEGAFAGMVLSCMSISTWFY